MSSPAFVWQRRIVQQQRANRRYLYRLVKADGLMDMFGDLTKAEFLRVGEDAMRRFKRDKAHAK